MIIRTRDGKIHHGEMNKNNFITIEGKIIPTDNILCECFKTHGALIEVPFKW